MFVGGALKNILINCKVIIMFNFNFEVFGEFFNQAANDFLKDIGFDKRQEEPEEKQIRPRKWTKTEWKASAETVDFIEI